MKRVHDQVFEIPPSFVLARVIPTGSELLYGFRHRWVSRGDIGQLAAALASSGIVLSPVEHEIVRATQDDPGRLDELVHETEVAEDYADGRDKVWFVSGARVSAKPRGNPPVYDRGQAVRRLRVPPGDGRLRLLHASATNASDWAQSPD